MDNSSKLFDQHAGLPLFYANVAYFEPKLQGSELLPFCFFLNINDQIHLLSHKYELLHGNDNGTPYQLNFMAEGVKDNVRLLFQRDPYDINQAPFLQVKSWKCCLVSGTPFYIYELENVPWLKSKNCLYPIPFPPQIDQEGRAITSIRTISSMLRRKFAIRSIDVKSGNKVNGNFIIKSSSKGINYGGPFLDNLQLITSGADRQRSVFGVLVDCEIYDSKKCIPIHEILERFRMTKPEEIFGQIPYDIDMGGIIDGMRETEMYSFEGYGKERGIVLIFNMRYYSKRSVDERYGSDVDCQRLEKLFKAIGFDVRMWDDGSQDLTSHFIENKVTETLNKDVASCIVFLMAHGGIEDETKRVVELSNGERYRINQIVKLFHKKLPGKPKCCFVVACHGPNRDYKNESRTEVAVNQTNTRPYRLLDADPTSDPDNQDLESVLLDSYSDILLVEAAYPGSVAARDKKLGSLYVNKFVEVFNNKYNIYSKDFLTLLRKVKDAVSSYEPMEYFQVPVITETMSDKNFYLCPGIEAYP